MVGVAAWLHTTLASDDGTRRMVVMGPVVAHVQPPADRRLDATVLQTVPQFGNRERAGDSPLL
jgi:hypothetical protein